MGGTLVGLQDEVEVLRPSEGTREKILWPFPTTAKLRAAKGLLSSDSL